ncbi:MAG: hypothetical protein OWS74_02700 [Firmicutes bacterium]|nr:hypothetical protein [Bacillota bacterium]
MDLVSHLVTFVGYFLASVFSVWSLYAPIRARLVPVFVLGGWLSQTWIYQMHAAGLVGISFEGIGLAFFIWLSALGYLFYWMIPPKYLHAPGDSRIIGSFLWPIIFVLWMLQQIFLSQVTWVHCDKPWALLAEFIATGAEMSFMLSAVFAIMYIEKEREVKKKHAKIFYYQLPALSASDQWNTRFMVAGVILGIGAFIVMEICGRHPALWTQLEGIGIIAVAYLIFVVLRHYAGWNGHRWAIFSILGFVVLMANFLTPAL